MFNPAAAAKVAKEILGEKPELLEQWAKQAETDPSGVRQIIMKMANDHGVKLSEGGLKMALAAAKPFLGKLAEKSREAAELLIKRIS